MLIRETLSPLFVTLGFTTNQALDDVYYGLKDPNLALDEAAARSATALGW